MSFAPKPGCPMCGIVASALHTPSHSPRAPSFPAGSKQPEVLWRDDNFTIYRERANPVSSKAHLVIIFNLHVPSLYMLSSSDLPLLVSLRDTSCRLLSSFLPSSSPAPSPSLDPQSATTSSATTPQHLLPEPLFHSSDTPRNHPSFRIGFITPPFRDSKIPVTDHLHAHAYILPSDLMGWWRAVGYSSIAWYAIDDLIAEIREESSNNRVRSGPSQSSQPRPIDLVPGAGARRGLPNGVETTQPSLGVDDPEDPESRPPRSRTSSTHSSASRASTLLQPIASGSRSPISPTGGNSRRGTTSPTSPLTVDVGMATLNAPYTGAGGALVMSPQAMSADGRRTPTSAGFSSSTGNLLLPNSQIPQINV